MLLPCREVSKDKPILYITSGRPIYTPTFPIMPVNYPKKVKVRAYWWDHEAPRHCHRDLGN
jgi:hypothetical protein